MLRRAQYLLTALFGMWVIALLGPGAGLANTIIEPITVTNSSFETASGPWDGTVDTIGLYNYSITEWNTTGSDGTWIPNLNYSPEFFTPSLVPDGTHVAWSNGGVISQALDVTLSSTGTYTLTVYVGRRNDFWPTPAFPNFPYLIGLFTGASFDGTNVLVSNYEPVNQGNWKAVTLTFTPQSGDPIGQQLGIFLYSAGTQVDFDKVSLTRSYEGVPIPASALLLGSGLAGLGLLRMRRKKIS